jgi:light-regulated signal transduction histidine kinase (bacteriophytochrome)
MEHNILANTRVLLVEDEVGHIEFISFLLESLGVGAYQVSSTEQEAIEQFKHFQPDIALLDIDLKAGGSGINVGKAIKAESDVPIIFITSNYDTATFAEVKKLKPHSFLDKQVNELKLRQSLELALQDYEELQQQRHEAERLSFVASHDLKEPLRNITSFAALLEKTLGEQLSDEAKTYLGYIKQGGSRMNALILGILENAQFSKNSLAQSEAVDLNEVFEYAKDFVQAEFKDRATSITSQPLPYLNTNRSLLEFVFKNLLHNAVKFNESETAEACIGFAIQGDKLELSFSDNGIGIPKAYKDKLFTMFKRLHPKDKYEGVGLGLALSQKAVAKLGGQLDFESEEGKGAKFRVVLPL